MHVAHHARTRLAAAVAALALGCALTACGSDEPEVTDEPTTTESSTTPTEASDSPSEEPSETDDGGQEAVQQFADRLEAGIAKTEQAHIEFTMTGTGGEMAGTGDVDYTAEPPEMQMSMEVGSESVDMVLVDGTMFVRSSQAGDKYLSFDLSDPNNPLGASFAEQLDPAASMKSFVKALSSVTSAGSEDVDGRSLDRYELTIDTTKLADQSQAAQLPADMNVTLWLDGQDRMARSVMDMGAVKYDATLSDFDKALDIEAPPTDQISEPPAS